MAAVRTIGRAVGMRVSAVGTGVLAVGILVLLAGSALAHCDSTTGPVIPEAKAALEEGNVTPILKWVTKENEAEITTAFTRAVAVRTNGKEARELADQYLLETLVRIHRAGEGAPYTGIKDEPVEPIVAMADLALIEGSAEEMTEKISRHMAEAITEKFARAVEAGRHKDESVAAGREFVEAYVTYIHYVEGIHAAIMSVGAHHADGGESTAGHGD